MVLSHLGETRLAELVINQCEQCRHDRTPLFDQCGKLDWRLFQGSFAVRQKWLLQRRKLFRSEHVKEISSRIRGDPLQAGGTLRREDALVYRAGLLNKTGPVEVTLRDKLNNFAHFAHQGWRFGGNIPPMTASGTAGFRSSALEDLRPSQVVFSGRLGRCEKLTSLGGRRRKFSAPIHMRRVQAAGATSLTKPLMRISSIKTTAISPCTATECVARNSVKIP
jgi:hypothetical protein